MCIVIIRFVEIEHRSIPAQRARIHQIGRSGLLPSGAAFADRFAVSPRSLQGGCIFMEKIPKNALARYRLGRLE